MLARARTAASLYGPPADNHLANLIAPSFLAVSAAAEMRPLLNNRSVVSARPAILNEIMPARSPRPGQIQLVAQSRLLVNTTRVKTPTD